MTVQPDRRLYPTSLGTSSFFPSYPLSRGWSRDAIHTPSRKVLHLREATSTTPAPRSREDTSTTTVCVDDSERQTPKHQDGDEDQKPDTSPETTRSLRLCLQRTP